MISATPRQRDLLAFIAGYQREHGYAPSFVEMRVALGLRNGSQVSQRLAALQERGLIRRLHNRARSVEIIQRPCHGPTGEPLRFIPIIPECGSLRERAAA